MEISSVNSTSSTEARMVVGAVHGDRAGSMSAGIAASSCGSRARMRSTVSMMLAPGWRKMISEIGRLAVEDARWRRMSSTRVGHRGDVAQPHRRAVR